MTAHVVEQLQDARNVLMLASSTSPDSGDLHHYLFGERTLDESNVLVLTFGRADRGTPNETAIVQIDETLQPSDSHPDNVTVQTVSPTDLTGVGMAVSDIIKEWSSTDTKTVVCFNSVTDFLQYADQSTMYRFLRVVTRRFDAADGFAHFHMNPNAHDKQTIATLKSPFDAVIDASDGGEVSVSTQY